MQVLKSIDTEEMREIEQMQIRQKNLHLVPTPVAFIDLEVIENGEVVSKYTDRSKSWVRNFYNFVTCQQMGVNSNALGTTYASGSLAVMNVDGSTGTGSYPLCHDQDLINSGAGNSLLGLVVGTGTTAESFSSHQLNSRILHGSMAGQLDYSATLPNPHIPTWNSGTKKMVMGYKRYFNNFSGGTIGVNEVGIYAALNYTIGVNTLVMLARDLLATTVNIPHASLLTATYTIEIPYPA